MNMAICNNIGPRSYGLPLDYVPMQ